MKTKLKYFGLLLFFIGILSFISTLGIGNFMLTKEIAKKTISDSNHYAALEPEINWMYNKPYQSKIKFIADYNSAFKKVNTQYKNKKEWDKVIYTNYAFPIVKASFDGSLKNNLWVWFSLTFILGSLGGLIYIFPDFYKTIPGIKNNGIFKNPSTNTGWIGILLGSGLIIFYIFLYKFPEYIVNWVILVDPLSYYLSGSEASQWFLYGFLYCLAMVVMGIRMFSKYRNNVYQNVRTSSVIFFQLCFAFLIPNILYKLNLPSADLKNIWPLDYTFFFDYHLNDLISHGTIGFWFLGWGIALFILVVPVMVYFFGKRWYCSWVCGCGGLAETLGDPYRQLSNKTLRAWKIEKYTVHGVLVFSVIMTGAVLYTYFTKDNEILGINTFSIRENYGFFIGFIFSGVIGTGFYPFMGNRMWCRFGCPLAAYLGIIQRFKSKFRITTNGGQCISCGNCSTYCEMGIDVRSYAQKGENIIRASCVGCGICAAVCPRGVLKLENTNEEGRFTAYIRPELLN